MLYTTSLPQKHGEWSKRTSKASKACWSQCQLCPTDEKGFTSKSLCGQPFLDSAYDISKGEANMDMIPPYTSRKDSDSDSKPSNCIGGKSIE
jgi:hypothetical protein